MNSTELPAFVAELEALEPDSLRQLIYDNDGHDIAIATADGSICLGVFQPAFEQSMPDFKRIIDRYNQVPALLALVRQLQGENAALQALATGLVNERNKGNE